MTAPDVNYTKIGLKFILFTFVTAWILQIHDIG